VYGEVTWPGGHIEIYVQPNPIIRRMTFTQAMEALDNIRRSSNMSSEFFVEAVAYQQAPIEEMERRAFSVQAMHPIKDKRARLREQGNTALSGYLVYDDAAQGRHPGVLMMPDRSGFSEGTIADAEMIAKLGYVVFAEDIFGKGIVPKSVPEMTELITIYNNDRPLMRARALAGFDVLKAQPMVDPTKLAAVGYCFGGTVGIELIETGAPASSRCTARSGTSHQKPPRTSRAVSSFCTAPKTRSPRWTRGTRPPADSRYFRPYPCAICARGEGTAIDGCAPQDDADAGPKA